MPLVEMLCGSVDTVSQLHARALEDVYEVQTLIPMAADSVALKGAVSRFLFLFAYFA